MSYLWYAYRKLIFLTFSCKMWNFNFPATDLLMYMHFLNEWTSKEMNKECIKSCEDLEIACEATVSADCINSVFILSAEVEYTSGGNIAVLVPYSTKKHQNQPELTVEAVIQEDGCFVCPRCSKVYRLYHSLRRHMRVECGHEPRHACPNCGRKFKHRFNLLAHMRTGACRKE